ncbi:MAG: glycosyltransferase family 4 protein [Mucilaginibacter sp.]|nr:glycosyltransferase family 4 protein [Mucilaginibacter sp.]
MDSIRVAYISFEHPLAETCGGIGAYVDQIATIMATRGHNVEVFTSTATKKSSSNEYKNYWVHQIPAKSNADFRTAVSSVFNAIHQQSPFDIIESAEYGADALVIKQNNPHVPLIVRLHTPTFLVDRLNFIKPSLTTKIRFVAGSILRGRLPQPYWKKKTVIDIEEDIYKLANTVTSPSKSLAAIVMDEWGKRDIKVLPNPYAPSQQLLKVRHQADGEKFRVLFLGRLEQRKGIYTLLSAIPQILKGNSNVFFTFAGADQPSYKKNLSVKALMLNKLSAHTNHLEFLGQVGNTQLNEVFANADVCVLPSIWENFPNACLESMAAGIPVIGSRAGGMAEIITYDKDGYLIEPKSPGELANAVLKLTGDKALLQKLGNAARQTVLERYNADVIGEATENIYWQTIKK